MAPTVATSRHPTAQRVLDAAVDAIERGGEEAIQVEPLVRELGLTVTAIYRWFGSRQGLVQAAQHERFTRLSSVGLDAWGAAMANATSVEAAHRVVDQLVNTALRPEQAEIRRRRVSALGSAFGRPELTAEIGVLVRQQVDEVARCLEQAHRGGLLSLQADARSVALWLPMVFLGRACFEIDPAPPSVEAWNQLCRRAVYLALVGAGPTTPITPMLAPEVVTWSEPDLPLIPEHPTPQLLVSLAIEMIDQHGEDGVKVEPLSRAAGLNVTTIYHWFGNRQGLIDVAQAVRFRRRARERLGSLEQAVRRTVDRAGARSMLDQMLLANTDADTIESQLQRLNALAATYARPTLAAALGTLHHRDRRHLAGILRQLQVPGYISPEVDLEAFSSWILGVVLAQALLTFDGRPEVIHGVRQLQRRVLQRVLFGDDVSEFAEELRDD
jgi:AcrR family transcriptional regulator